MSYKWLLFDLDNTILDFNASSVIAFNIIIDRLGIPYKPELVKTFKKINLEVWDELEHGLIDHQELKSKRWSLLFKSIGVTEDPHSANNYYFEHIKSNPVYVDHALEMIQQCSDHYKLMLITNGLSEVQRPRLERTGLNKYFQHIVISDELGHAKPHKEYFEHCHELMNAPMKDRVLVIGDTLRSDILGGNNFGYHTCWYNHTNTSETDSGSNFEITDLRELRGILQM